MKLQILNLRVAIIYRVVGVLLVTLLCLIPGCGRRNNGQLTLYPPRNSGIAYIKAPRWASVRAVKVAGGKGKPAFFSVVMVSNNGSSLSPRIYVNPPASSDLNKIGTTLLSKREHVRIAVDTNGIQWTIGQSPKLPRYGLVGVCQSPRILILFNGSLGKFLQVASGVHILTRPAPQHLRR